MADPALPNVDARSGDLDIDFLRQCYGHYTSRGAPQSSWSMNDQRVRLLLHGTRELWTQQIDWGQLRYTGSSSGGGTPSEGTGHKINTMHRDNIVFNQDSTVKPGFINATYPLDSLTGVKVTKEAQYDAFYDPEGYHLQAETKVLNGNRGDLNLDTLFYYPYGIGSPVYDEVALWVYGKWRLTNDDKVDLRMQILEFKDDWYSSDYQVLTDSLLADGRSYSDVSKVNDIVSNPHSCRHDYPYKILRFQLKVARYGAPAWQNYRVDFSQVCVREVYF